MSTFTAINLVARPAPGPIGADTESYIPPVGLGEVMRSSGIGEVVESNHPDFTVGERLMGLMGWTEYLLSTGEGLRKVQPGLDEEMVLSVFALPGLTATQGLFGFGHPKAGETIVVSGAAGSVGSIVGQLAKAVVCGMISDYTAETPSAGPNWIPIIKKRITIQGFAMPDHFGQLPELIGKLTPYVMQGKIKHRAHVLNGLESAIDGLNLLLSGGNKGKLIVKL